MQKKLLYILFGLLPFSGSIFAQQNPDKVWNQNIHTVLIHPVGEALGAPIYMMSNGTPLLISFDDFAAQYQDYYFSVELMDSVWNPISMNSFEYLKGFNENKITQFSVSSIAAQKYFHYQFTFPDNNVSPKLSGNYIIKVYKDNNKDNLVFTRRMYVVDPVASVATNILEPFDGAISKTHQRISVNVDCRNIPSFQNDRITVKVIQNNRYNDPQTVTTPSFIRNTILEFNNESELLFPAGKEARWLDLQSLRLRSDRVAEIDNKGNIVTVTVKPDISRMNMGYLSYKDLNGNFLISNTESLQNETQNDYAEVLFTYLPQDHIPYLDKRLYLSGALTNNSLDPQSEMRFNAQLGLYQKRLLLKQGYYSYNYILRDRLEPNAMEDFAFTEGDHGETENN